MRREFVAAWAVVDALEDDIDRAIDRYGDPSSSQIAAYLFEAGWRPGGDA